MAALSGQRYSIRRLRGLGLWTGIRMTAARLRRLYESLVGASKPGDQPLVAVGRRVGERAERGGVLEQAADGVQPQVAQAGVAVAGQERLPRPSRA